MSGVTTTDYKGINVADVNEYSKHTGGRGRFYAWKREDKDDCLYLTTKGIWEKSCVDGWFHNKQEVFNLIDSLDAKPLQKFNLKDYK